MGGVWTAGNADGVNSVKLDTGAVSADSATDVDEALTEAAAAAAAATGTVAVTPVVISLPLTAAAAAAAAEGCPTSAMAVEGGRCLSRHARSFSLSAMVRYVQTSALP